VYTFFELVIDVIEPAPVARWNVYPGSLHHRNAPVRGASQQLVTRRTQSSGWYCQKSYLIACTTWCLYC